MTGTLTITSPATDSQAGFSTSTIPVTWSFAGTGGAIQTQRRVTATPVGGSTATFDTGMAVSTETTHTVDGFATGVSYNVTVSVIDTAGTTTTATRVVVSNYTRPLPPVIYLIPGESGMAVQVINPTDGSRPAVTTNAVYRRLAGTNGDWTFLGTTGPNSTFGDFTSAARTSYDYFVRANGQVDSPISTTTGAEMAGAWVHDITNAYATIQHYPYAQAAAESVDIESAVLAFVGRTYPVAEVGVARTDTLAVSIRLPPDVRQAAEETWRAWRRNATTLYYRDGRGRSWPAAITAPVTIAPDGHGSILSTTLQRVDTTSTTLAAGAYAYPTSLDGGKGVGGKGATGKGL
jgi:hypothetical protein